MPRYTPLDLLFEEPPPTKEDAAEQMHPNGGWYRDGFDGGSELPDDEMIDDMVFPHDHSKRHHEQRERKIERDAALGHFKHEAFEMSKRFKITEENVTGECPGPPKYFQKEGNGGDEDEDED